MAVGLVQYARFRLAMAGLTSTAGSPSLTVSDRVLPELEPFCRRRILFVVHRTGDLLGPAGYSLFW